MIQSRSAVPSHRAVSVRRFVGVAAVGLLTASTAGAQGGPPPEGRRAPAIGEAELLQKVRTTATQLTNAGRFSGVILLAKDGNPVFEQAYGLADREARRPVRVTTTFNVSSVGKLFTQVAIGQLAAAGKISLDSTIAAYWPDYPDPIAARKVTIRMLLAHRSGIDGNIFVNPVSVRSNHDNLPAATGQPLAFEPGTRQQYSNAGYVVLGEIIERVSREVYHEYIRRHVFAAAGMSSSDFPALDSLPPDAAIGYTWGTDAEMPLPNPLPPLRRAAPVQPRRGSAAGGAYSNARDLLRFVLARRNGTLGLPARRAQEIAAGGSPGSNALIAEGLPGGYDVIVLSNFDPPTAGSVVDSVERWLGGGRGGPADGPMGGPLLMVPRGAPGAAADGLQPPPEGPLQATLPDTPQGKLAEGYLRAFSTGDDAAMRAFLEAHITPNALSTDDRVRRYREIFSDLGALTLRGVRVSPDGSLALQVNSARNGELTMMMSFDAGAVVRIAGVQFLLER